MASNAYNNFSNRDDLQQVPFNNSAGDSKNQTDARTKYEVYDLETPRPKSDFPQKARAGKHHLAGWAIKYALIVLGVAIPLIIPVILFRNDQEVDEDEPVLSRQYRQLVFYIFCWLLSTWLFGCLTDMLALGFPYLFRFVAKYVIVPCM